MFNIAIDGPSAAGKTTISKLLAANYQMKHLDTGSMYRALAYACIQSKVDCKREDEIVHLFTEVSIGFTTQGSVTLNGSELKDEIRSEEISILASDISKFLKVREALVSMQRDISKDGGYILDGRDVGSVILPNAEIKLYLDADPSIRSKRRYDEYLAKGKTANYDEIHNDMVKRDTQDMNREHSPLKCVEDALNLDTSDLSIEEVVQVIDDFIKTKDIKVR